MIIFIFIGQHCQTGGTEVFVNMISAVTTHCFNRSHTVSSDIMAEQNTVHGRVTGVVALFSY